MSLLRASDLPPALRAKLGLAEPAGRSKYGAVKKVVDGERFDSAKEARRFQELRALERVKEIENLQRQPQFLITRDGIVLATYSADFRYQQRSSRAWIVEDVKGGKGRRGTRTEAYQLRKRLVEAQYLIEIREV